MYLGEYVSDKIAHSETKDLQCAVDATLEFLRRAGIITERQQRNIPHSDLDLDARRSGLTRSVVR